LEKYIIRGGRPLSGEVEISGAKNAAVAIIPAVILADEPCVLENVPNISDVSASLHILESMGASVKRISHNSFRIDATHMFSHKVNYDSARCFRASYYFMGALLGKYGEAFVSMPGGCDLGDRPMDQHIKAFTSLGARCEVENGCYNITSGERLGGSLINFDVVSVGATINAMLASVKVKGLTVIENAAKEPHIVDAANFLNSCGANIMGAGTDTIKVRGVDYLHSSTYSIIPDQIEAGTFMIAAAASKGDVLIKKHHSKAPRINNKPT